MFGTNVILNVPINSKENFKKRQVNATVSPLFLPVSEDVKKHTILHQLCTLTEIYS